MFWSGIQIIIHKSDKVLLGYLASPVLVAKYVITNYMADMIKSLIMYVISGTLPGLSKLYGTGDLEKLRNIKSLIYTITWIFCIGIGSIGLLFNQSFVHLWVGGDKYAGQLPNLLLIVIVIQYMLLFNDSELIDITLNIRKKVMIGAISAVSSITLIVLLVPKYEIIGLAIAIIIGRSIMSIMYPILVNQIINVTNSKQKIDYKKILTVISLFTTCFVLGDKILITNWLVLISISFISFTILIIFSFYTTTIPLEREKI